MSPVALFDLVEREAAHRVGGLTVPQVREARSAVDELVDASRALRDEWDRQDNGQFDVMPAKDFFAAEARWRAALARFEVRS